MKIWKKIFFLLVFLNSLDVYSSYVNKVTYAAWKKPDVDLYYVLPSKINKDTKVLFIIHGASRNVERYLNVWIDESKNKNVILVAPHFKKNDFKYYSTLGMARHSGSIIKDRQNWLDGSISNFFTYFKNKFVLSSDQYLIYGFSGGSQFVHRYLIFGVDDRIEKASIGSAGWYTFINDSPYPYGLNGVNVKNEKIEWMLSREVLFLLGENDTDPNHSLLNKSPGSIKQGLNRYERGVSYFDHLVKLADNYQVPLRWRYKLILDSDHDMEAISQPAIKFLLDDLEYQY